MSIVRSFIQRTRPQGIIYNFRLVRSAFATSTRSRDMSSKPDNVSSILASININGDLNNTSAARFVEKPVIDPSYSFKSLAIPEAEDDAEIRTKYRPFLLDERVRRTDWVAKLELATATKMAETDLRETGDRVKILMLYGSLRKRSYSKLLTYEIARILFRLGCDVRIYDPTGLPVKDDEAHNHPKVQELRDLSRWSDGHFWVSPEQHGTLTAVFKNQIDWIPLSTGSVRPTQGRTLGIAMVSGGSQSFNTVNSLRVLGRWMRMFVIPNQSSVPMAYKLFTPERDESIRQNLVAEQTAEAVGVPSAAGNSYETGGGTVVGGAVEKEVATQPVNVKEEEGDEDEGGSRMMPGGNRDRLVDCAEELVKYTIVMRRHFALFGDRHSERKEAEEKRLKAEAAK